MALLCPNCATRIPRKLMRQALNSDAGKRRATSDLRAIGKIGGLAARGKSGRPRTAERCPCGAMSVERAKQRNHKC